MQFSQEYIWCLAPHYLQLPICEADDIDWIIYNWNFEMWYSANYMEN